ncbi:hypothetical protein ACFL3S_13810, partial [Gemmatimonadota bacterium]
RHLSEQTQKPPSGTHFVLTSPPLSSHTSRISRSTEAPSSFTSNRHPSPKVGTGKSPAEGWFEDVWKKFREGKIVQ